MAAIRSFVLVEQKTTHWLYDSIFYHIRILQKDWGIEQTSRDTIQLLKSLNLFLGLKIAANSKNKTYISYMSQKKIFSSDFLPRSINWCPKVLGTPLEHWDLIWFSTYFPQNDFILVLAALTRAVGWKSTKFREISTHTICFPVHK